MSTLIVTAHPDPGSLTHHAARRLHEVLGDGATETAHLAQEGVTAFLRDSESTDRAAVERAAEAAAATIAAAIAGG